jgi:hypothetical protein
VLEPRIAAVAAGQGDVTIAVVVVEIDVVAGPMLAVRADGFRFQDSEEYHGVHLPPKS